MAGNRLQVKHNTLAFFIFPNVTDDVYMRIYDLTEGVKAAATFITEFMYNF